MGPGGIASRILTGSLAFTGAIVVVIVIMTSINYMSEVTGVSGRRTMTVIITFLFMIGMVLILSVMFPDLTNTFTSYLYRLVYR